MSRDRLAALRAQRQEQQQPQAHELDTFDTRPPTTTTINDAMPSFFDEVTSLQADIEQLNGNVAIISTLHLRLGNVLNDGPNPDAQQLDLMRDETRTLIDDLRDRIKNLETLPGPDRNIRRNQAALVRSKFLEAIQNYQRVEQDYRLQARRKVERQVKIVKPDATDEEVKAAVEGGGDQIFTQALANSTRYGESRAAYQEVQQRQQDLRKMEDTLAVLAQLLSDMALLVDQQDEAIDEIEKTGKDVESNTKKGFEHTVQAVIHARRYRKMRWICFFIFLTVLAILGLVLGIVLGTRSHK